MVHCTGGVENWLGKLLHEMQETVKSILALMSTSLLDPEFNFVVEFQTFCGQVKLILS